MHATNRGVIVAIWAATAAAAFGMGWITSPPHTSTHESPTPDNLATSIRSALGEGNEIERQRRTASLLEQLNPDDLPEVLALYEQMIPVIGASELGRFFAAWAGFDAGGALEHALSWPLMEKRSQQEAAVRAAIQVWALRDPAAAQLASVEIAAEHVRLRDALLRGVMTGWVYSHRGQEGLGNFLADLPPLHHRTELIDNATRELVRKGGADAVLSWVEPILVDESYDPLFKQSVFRSAATSAAQWDPGRTAAWAMEHLEADYAEDGLRSVGKQWGRQDGTAAMAWLGERPAGESRDRAVREAFTEWSKANPLQAKAWLESENPTAMRDPALEIKAERVAPHVPQMAIGWCERIHDSSRQQKCLESTAHSWYGRNPVAAEAWLQKSSLDDEARGRVRKISGKQGQKQPGQSVPSPQRPRAGGGQH
ncbi:MAG: hypothetical protein JRD03_10770 [Deltaproteobacteria bacterium]|nr:hypothetical protein [Deltaproteobacteria bacterium]